MNTGDKIIASDLLVNKQDRLGAMPVSKFQHVLADFQSNQQCIIGCSAKSGDGLSEALDFLKASLNTATR